MLSKISSLTGKLLSSFKSLLALLIVAWFGGYVLYFYVHSLEVVVRPITLPSSVSSSGYDAQSITEYSLADVQVFVSKSKSTNFRSVVSTADSKNCRHPNFLMAPALEEIGSQTLDGISISTALPDWTVPKQGVSLARLALSIRESLGIGVVQFVPALRHSEAGYELVLDVQNSASGSSARLTRYFADLEQTEALLTEVFAIAISPELGAALQQHGDHGEFDILRDLAKVVNSNDRVFSQIDFSQMLLLGYWPLTGADIRLDQFRSGLIATELLANTEWIESASSSQILAALNSMALGRTAIQGELSNASMADGEELERLFGLEGLLQEEIDTLFETARIDISDWAQQIASQSIDVDAFFLAMILVNTGFEEKAINSLKANATSTFELKNESLALNIASVLVIAEGLINLGKYESANELLETAEEQIVQNSIQLDPYYYEALSGAASFSRALSGDPKSLVRYLKFANETEAPCLVARMAHSASLLLGGEPAPLVVFSQEDELVLLEEIQSAFDRVEASGFSNFGFFNNFGRFLADRSKFEEAISKYGKALEHPGDHVWAHLNIGHSFFALGRFAEAASAFEESLKIGTVPNAVYGRMNSLAKLGEHEQLFLEFRQYSDVFARLSEEDLMTSLRFLSDLACQNEFQFPNNYFSAFSLSLDELDSLLLCS